MAKVERQLIWTAIGCKVLHFEANGPDLKGLRSVLSPLAIIALWPKWPSCSFLLPLPCHCQSFVFVFAFVFAFFALVFEFFVYVFAFLLYFSLCFYRYIEPFCVDLRCCECIPCPPSCSWLTQKQFWFLLNRNLLYWYSYLYLYLHVYLYLYMYFYHAAG